MNTKTWLGKTLADEKHLFDINEIQSNHLERAGKLSTDSVKSVRSFRRRFFRLYSNMWTEDFGKFLQRRRIISILILFLSCKHDMFISSQKIFNAALHASGSFVDLFALLLWPWEAVWCFIDQCHVGLGYIDRVWRLVDCDTLQVQWIQNLFAQEFISVSAWRLLRNLIWSASPYSQLLYNQRVRKGYISSRYEIECIVFLRGSESLPYFKHHIWFFDTRPLVWDRKSIMSACSLAVSSEWSKSERMLDTDVSHSSFGSFIKMPIAVAVNVLLSNAIKYKVSWSERIFSSTSRYPKLSMWMVSFRCKIFSEMPEVPDTLHISTMMKASTFSRCASLFMSLKEFFSGTDSEGKALRELEIK